MYLCLRRGRETSSAFPVLISAVRMLCLRGCSLGPTERGASPKLLIKIRPLGTVRFENARSRTARKDRVGRAVTLAGYTFICNLRGHAWLPPLVTHQQW